MVRLTIVLLLLLPLVACGGSPSTPSSTASDRIRMAEGQYRLSAQINPFDPRYPACSGSFSPSVPGSFIVVVPVNATAVVRWEDGDWIARPESAADGDFELRFRDSGASAPPGSVPVRGTLRGVLMPRANEVASTKLFASFAGSPGPAAEIAGTLSIAGQAMPSLSYSMVRGMARGEIVFWSDPGGRSTCQIVDWMLAQVVTF